MRYWIKIYLSKNLQKYDYGSERENKKHYGTETPQVYNLDKFKKYAILSLMTISIIDSFSKP